MGITMITGRELQPLLLDQTSMKKPKKKLIRRAKRNFGGSSIIQPLSGTFVSLLPVTSERVAQQMLEAVGIGRPGWRQVELQNGMFGLPDLAKLDEAAEGKYLDCTGTDIPGWTINGVAGVFSPTSAVVQTYHVARQIAYINTGHVEATLPAIQPGAASSCRLMVWLFCRADRVSGGVSVSLAVGGKTFYSGVQQPQTEISGHVLTVDFDISQADSAQPLSLIIAKSHGPQCLFGAVRLILRPSYDLSRHTFLGGDGRAFHTG